MSAALVLGYGVTPHVRPILVAQGGRPRCQQGPHVACQAVFTFTSCEWEISLVFEYLDRNIRRAVGEATRHTVAPMFLPQSAAFLAEIVTFPFYHSTPGFSPPPTLLGARTE
jgi:hypothetical protein